MKRRVEYVSLRKLVCSPTKNTMSPLACLRSCSFLARIRLKMTTNQTIPSVFMRLARALLTVSVLIGVVGFKSAALGQG